MQLTKDEIHLWPINLSDQLNRCGYFFDLLDEDEKARALRFRFKKDRDCFTISHGILREILSKYILCDPRAIVFEFGEHQKPFIKNNDLGVQFNLSHSHFMAFIAVTLDDPVGVDVEWARENNDLDQLVSRFFSTVEINEYFSLPQNQRKQAFYHAWSRKEAFIKATGNGLFQELKSFSVNLTPGKLAKVLSVENDEASFWKLYTLEIEKNYAAAVCWRGSNKKLMTKLMEWL